MLYRNDIFIDHVKNRRARLLYADPYRNEAVTFDLANPDALPVIESLSNLLDQERANTLTIERGVVVPLNENKVSFKAQLRRDAAWARLEPLVTNSEIYSKETRFSLIKERASEVGCSVVTLLKDLRRYWAGGQTKSALFGKFHLCGYKSPTHQTSAGRKPHLSNYGIFRVKPHDEAYMHAAIKSVYLKSDGLSASTASDAYQRLLENHYSYNDGNGNRIINEKGERPTIRQFYSFLHKHYSFEVITRRRKSDAEFERDHAAKTGSALLDCLGVGHIYEIDSTIADVFLVSSKDRSRIIGKPTLYLVVDRRSRLIVGFYVGLEASSWAAAMHAILSISEDKAALCARYGVEYSAEDWPADAIYPSMFLADRGSEMLSHNSSLVVNGLQITVSNLPKQRPDYKPAVECGFKLLHRSIVDATPGYEPPHNVTKRQGKHYEKDACLTLDEFISIILKAIIVHNHTPMPNYQLPVESLSRGVRAIPVEIWNDEAPRRIGALTRFQEEFVRFSLLPKTKATVTHQGIFFNGCYYSAPTALQNGWFIRTGKGVSYIDISYDRRLADTIYVHDDKDPTKFYVAHLLEKSGGYRGLSFAEIEAYELLRKKLNPVYEQIGRQNRSELHIHTDPITRNALNEAKAASRGKSRSSRKADVVNDRLDERRTRRQEEAVMPSRLSERVAGEDEGSLAEVLPLGSFTSDASVSMESSPTIGAPAPKTLGLAEKMKQKRLEMLNADA